MPHEYFNEELDDDQYRDLVTKNMMRIKESIYGNADGRPAPSRSGPWTSGRKQDT